MKQASPRTGLNLAAEKRIQRLLIPTSVGDRFEERTRYLPNVAAPPEGPVKFNVDTQASVFDVAQSELSGGTINPHGGARDLQAKTLLQILGVAKHAGNEGYVASAASDVLVKLPLMTMVYPLLRPRRR
jgi:hypothetical protein